MKETIERHLGLPFYICIVTCCLSPWILLVNGLTVVIAIRYVTRVTPTHVAVAYLAAVDFLVGMTPWFQLTTYLTQGNKQWGYWCIFSNWLENVSVVMNLNAVMLIAIERYFLITKWNRHPRNYSAKKHGMVTGISTLLIILTLILIIIVGEVNPIFGRCHLVFNKKKTIVRLMRGLCYVVISLLLIVSYVRIVFFLWKQRRAAMVRIQTHLNRSRRTTVLVTLVVTIYIVTTVPGAIYLLVLSTVHGDNITKSQVNILGILFLIYYCNSIVNPIIYAFRIPDFKKAYCKIFDIICKTERNRVDVMNTPGNNMDELRGPVRINVPLEPRRFSFRLEPRRDFDTMFRTSLI